MTISVSEEMQDLAGVQPFALGTEDLPKYLLTYTGKEKIDELDTYVFDVKPKEIRKGERYLQGRIWVDDQDLQIVKVAGQGVPEEEHNNFRALKVIAKILTGGTGFRLMFSRTMCWNSRTAAFHVRFNVRYTNYRKFSGRIRITDEGEAATEDEVKNADKNKPAPTPVKPPEQPQPKKRP